MDPPRLPILANFGLADKCDSNASTMTILSPTLTPISLQSSFVNLLATFASFTLEAANFFNTESASSNISFVARASLTTSGKDAEAAGAKPRKSLITRLDMLVGLRTPVKVIVGGVGIHIQ